MKTKNSNSIIYAICSLLVSCGLISCETSQDITDDATSANLFLGFADSTHTQNTLESLVVNQATFYMEEIRFEGESDYYDDFELRREFKPAKAIDLLMISAGSELISQIPAGPYQEIELRLKSPDRGGNPILEFRGSFTDSLQQTIPFQIQLFHEFDIRVEEEHEEHHIYFDLDYLQNLDLQERFMQIFKSIDHSLWADLEIDLNGVITINQESNMAIFSAISNAIGEDFRLRKRYD